MDVPEDAAGEIATVASALGSDKPDPSGEGETRQLMFLSDSEIQELAASLKVLWEKDPKRFKALKAADAARKHLSKVSRGAKKSVSRPGERVSSVSEVQSETGPAAKRAAKNPTRRKAGRPKRAKRRAARPAQPAIATEEAFEQTSEPDTFDLSEADLSREIP